MTQKAVFLDRDGVLVEEIFYPHTGEREAPLGPNDVCLLPGAAQGLRDLRAAGFSLVVVSNQGAAAKGKVSIGSLWLAHLRFLDLCAAEGIAFDGCHYSFSHPNGTVPHLSGSSLERKPSPYFLHLAAAQLDIDLTASWMVGDRETDVQCGQAAGARAIRLCNPVQPSAAEVVASDLPEAAFLIIAAAR
ncbi:D-glycero-alpha-D-manno-heptose-1,7-bisphosphate 7-phosphatase [Bosea sp. NBC_00550]|uniref:D-glycero-alpha-D-manno-heptose-1,7-bisphosphate 7-phosphatase n=1 Tax=Bosea sp. NBC_00550 TaxID=2969621 RepID=UPI00222ED22B|nr:HAD-IIIA family hydrolase [Bosea sp. NBC_00550]UZF91288.1 HAD-IIIA family hydrolase [Bosea sp. NBC_00550]